MDKAGWGSTRIEVEAEGGVERDTHINRHVFPQAPSPTMTSFRRSSAILEKVFDADGREGRCRCDGRPVNGWEGLSARQDEEKARREKES